ncbi:hypothetical protein H6G33_25110 [Calothrix sp. FACHB-1219]|uniref:hypothetical protein n=1 Tax=unclassified Calothrix TaxID=2619626 RepID=UPI0016824F1F|nr:MULTISPECIES: hypothetical protein [unclassified Calothrix]MBD2205626.1 hypothetical protein [Calothrix sp. FACHB-168]MBD2220289.1 hypothetical protein [Calothrix sp. FACHB-1219]
MDILTFGDLLKAAGNSMTVGALGARPAVWGIGHWYVLSHAPFPRARGLVPP